ncbi:MAG: DeoR family transcriptional regulator, partial [Spirochaetes bacterium]|nr:DeoR family transcriptional regulator [Spirochaetota bacterium]
MNTQMRHQEIMNILYKRKTVNVNSLTKRLNVSEVTIRKDLSTLEAHGKVIRTHGGASLAEDIRKHQPVNLRFLENIEIKRKIASQARKLINENDI